MKYFGKRNAISYIVISEIKILGYRLQRKEQSTIPTVALSEFFHD